MSANASKGKIGGGISFAAEGSTLPTDAKTQLAEVFKSLGYISEDGVSRDISLDNQIVRDWHGSVVAVLENGKTETFKFKVIDCTNVDTLGLVYGKATGTISTGITVESNSDIKGKKAYVIESVLSDGTVQRICIPSAVITGIGSITYKGSDVTGFELTLTAIADESGNTAYEYLLKSA